MLGEIAVHVLSLGLGNLRRKQAELQASYGAVVDTLPLGRVHRHQTQHNSAKAKEAAAECSHIPGRLTESVHDHVPLGAVEDLNARTPVLYLAPVLVFEQGWRTAADEQQSSDCSSWVGKWLDNAVFELRVPARVNQFRSANPWRSQVNSSTMVIDVAAIAAAYSEPKGGKQQRG